MQPKFCNKCGNALKEGDKFCRRCGAPVRQAQAPAPAPQAPAQPAPQTMAMPGGYDIKENPEGTVLLGDINKVNKGTKTVKKAELALSIDEMLRGCSKVVDFGTGKRFELSIPPGLTPGDTIVVENTGIVDKVTGSECDFELTAIIE